MENKQPEDDLFDRLNVSGQSALGCRGRGPARVSRAPKERFSWGQLRFSLHEHMGKAHGESVVKLSGVDKLCF